MICLVLVLFFKYKPAFRIHKTPLLCSDFVFTLCISLNYCFLPAGVCGTSSLLAWLRVDVSVPQSSSRPRCQPLTRLCKASYHPAPEQYPLHPQVPCQSSYGSELESLPTSAFHLSPPLTGFICVSAPSEHYQVLTLSHVQPESTFGQQIILLLFVCLFCEAGSPVCYPSWPETCSTQGLLT